MRLTRWQWPSEVGRNIPRACKQDRRDRECHNPRVARHGGAGVGRLHLPGDTLVIDIWRMLHARFPITPGMEKPIHSTRISGALN